MKRYYCIHVDSDQNPNSHYAVFGHLMDWPDFFKYHKLAEYFELIEDRIDTALFVGDDSKIDIFRIFSGRWKVSELIYGRLSILPKLEYHNISVKPFDEFLDYDWQSIIKEFDLQSLFYTDKQLYAKGSIDSIKSLRSEHPELQIHSLFRIG